ncbi:hypothetical protein PflSS101_3050 [Pseudomonas lactis]|uniref:Uncharacterized protein n=1 Tax=Pseudomonas lactis TaxID=1615674 RepID=I4KFB4_9PSED|nr:hypothetical protein PflSS101_3050 [Pseudomonas lactis]
MDGAWRRPTDSSLRSGTPSPGEVPSGGARAFCLLLSGPAFRLFKSKTPSGRNPKRPLPQQWICTQSNCVACQAAFASKPAPTFGLWGVRWIGVAWKAVIAGKPAPTGSICSRPIQPRVA